MLQKLSLSDIAKAHKIIEEQHTIPLLSLSENNEWQCYLLDVMPTPYQRHSLPALLELFLRAQGTPLPEHSSLKS
ncbi:hypothetical protein, partial [Trichocoleus sp. FACHB-46]